MFKCITIPKLGMAATNAEIVEWKVKEGEKVEEHQIIVAIQTAKTLYDIEAEVAGFIHISIEQGSELPVGTEIGVIAESEAELENLKSVAIKQTQTKNTDKISNQVAISNSDTITNLPNARIMISPVARNLAEEHEIDISQVKGTGPGGRIVKEDIEKAVASKCAMSSDEIIDGKKVKSTIPIKGMRKAISEHMHRSLTVSAQLTAFGEIDMTQCIKLRNDLLAHEEKFGCRITYTDIFVLLTAKALNEYPMVNSSVIGNEIKIWDDINIGIAVAAPNGLIVPVVRNANKKSLIEISHITKALVTKAKEGKLVPDDVMGSTFTISNPGALGAGWRFETAIINQPETAILSLGGIADRVVARDGQIVIRPIMTYSFTYDHRVIDGASSLQFMSSVFEFTENPVLLIA
jgi:pyruvate dehydrogenase E2 component (dihydrolipoamide acetyltransferase)